MELFSRPVHLVCEYRDRLTTFAIYSLNIGMFANFFWNGRFQRNIRRLKPAPVTTDGNYNPHSGCLSQASAPTNTGSNFLKTNGISVSIISSSFDMQKKEIYLQLNSEMTNPLDDLVWRMGIEQISVIERPLGVKLRLKQMDNGTALLTCKMSARRSLLGKRSTVDNESSSSKRHASIVVLNFDYSRGSFEEDSLEYQTINMSIKSVEDGILENQFAVPPFVPAEDETVENLFPLGESETVENQLPVSMLTLAQDETVNNNSCMWCPQKRSVIPGLEHRSSSPDPGFVDMDQLSPRGKETEVCSMLFCLDSSREPNRKGKLNWPEFGSETSAQDGMAEHQFTTSPATRIKDESVEYQFTTSPATRIKDESVEYQFTTSPTTRIKDETVENQSSMWSEDQKGDFAAEKENVSPDCGFNDQSPLGVPWKKPYSLGKIVERKRPNSPDFGFSEMIESQSDTDQKPCGNCGGKLAESKFLDQRRYGLLSHCDHVFCYRCIYEHCKLPTDSFIASAVCPECLVASTAVAVSGIWREGTEKKDFFEAFQNELDTFFKEIVTRNAFLIQKI